MPEGRFLSRSIALNEQLARVSILADHLFTKAIPHLDVEGRMPGNPMLVRSIVVPLRREYTDDGIPELLCELCRERLIIWYSAGGRAVLSFPGFERQQRGLNKQREAPSRLPGPTEAESDLYTSYSGPKLEELRLSKVKVSEVKEREVKPLVELGLSVPDSNGTNEGRQTLVGQADGLSVALTLTSENPIVPVNGNGHRPKTHVEIREHLAMVLGEVQQGRKDRIRVEEMRTIKAELVFAYWQAELGHEKAKLDPTRLNRLKKCLKGNGDNVHELLYAVDGWSKDPTFRQLAEKEGRKLDGIENIFESQSRIERLAGHCKGYRDSTPHRMAVKYLEAVQS